LKKELKESLQVLVGLKLSRATRAINMQCFQFGRLQPIRKGFIGEFSLHIQCPWRLTNGHEIIVGSEDLYEQPFEKAEYNPEFEWDAPMANLRDVKLHNFMESNQLTVLALTPDNYGGLDINFNEEINLTLFPTITGKNEFLEYWRLLNNKSGNGGSLVVGPLGTEQVREE